MSPTQQPLRILIVDDEPMIIQMLTRFLGSHELFVANTFEAAADLMQRECLDVVITDSLSPGFGGLNILRLSRRLQPDTVRIMFSANSLDYFREFVTQGLIHHYYHKVECSRMLKLVNNLPPGSASSKQ